MNLLWLLATCLMFLSKAAMAKSAEKQPNIVTILVDDLVSTMRTCFYSIHPLFESGLYCNNEIITTTIGCD